MGCGDVRRAASRDRWPAAFASSIKLDGCTHRFAHLVNQPALLEDRLRPFRDEIEAFAKNTTLSRPRLSGVSFTALPPSIARATRNGSSCDMRMSHATSWTASKASTQPRASLHGSHTGSNPAINQLVQLRPIEFRTGACSSLETAAPTWTTGVADYPRRSSTSPLARCRCESALLRRRRLVDRVR